MENYDKDVYFVAIKLFIRDGDKLLIIHDIFGSWDLPGGRIKPDEFNKPLTDVIERKIAEEIGNKVKLDIGYPNGILFRVERKEQKLDRMVRIFAVGYDVEYIAGKVQLGNHHDRMEWVDVNTFKPTDFFTGGWLTGVEEYVNRERQKRAMS